MRKLRWAGKLLSYGFILANSMSKALAFWIHIPKRLKYHRKSGLKSLQWICEKHEYYKQCSFPWLSYLFYYYSFKNIYCWRLSHSLQIKLIGARSWWGTLSVSMTERFFDSWVVVMQWLCQKEGAFTRDDSHFEQQLMMSIKY